VDAAAGAELAHLDLRPHHLRHAFATWLEDAALPSRVIDELMGYVGGAATAWTQELACIARDCPTDSKAAVAARFRERPTVAGAPADRPFHPARRVEGRMGPPALANRPDEAHHPVAPADER
jgi:hypothetical protein